MEITRDEAIQVAKEYDLEQEVIDLIDSGYTPEEALEEWDILLDEHIPFLPPPNCVTLDDYYCDSDCLDNCDDENDDYFYVSEH